MRYFHRSRSFEAILFLLFINPAFFPAMICAVPEDQGFRTEAESKFYNQNERCFGCHGRTKYTYFNKVSGREVAGMMCGDRVILRDEFYAANHRSFACIDCHAAEYDTFPHPEQLRMESQYNCIDCHGNDKKFARYHFEEIEGEFQQSVHYTSHGDAFTCWKCHNPHSYKINIRNSKNLTRSIAYDNQICLNCHSDFQRFQILTDREEINLIRKHHWLPNQALHFSQVRCIECHARMNDSLLVAHRIMPKEKAVKRCVECHSQNSLLTSSLYKYQARENRIRAGFMNAIILNNAFVIGANRNAWLNKLSVVIFIITVLFLLVHFVLLRIRKKRT